MMSKQRLFGKYLVFFVTYFLLLSYCIVFNNEAGWSLLFFVTLLVLADLLFILPSLNKIQVTLEESIQTQINKETPFAAASFQVSANAVANPKAVFALSKSGTDAHFYRGESIRLEVLWLPTARGAYNGLPLTLTSQELLGILQKKAANENPTRNPHFARISTRGPILMTLFEKSRENILTGNQISPFETTVTISKGIH